MASVTLRLIALAALSSLVAAIAPAVQNRQLRAQSLHLSSGPGATTDFGGCKFSANGKDDIAKTGFDIKLTQEKATDDITIALMDGQTAVNTATLKGTQKRGADAVFDYAQADKGSGKLSFTLTVTGNKENAPFLRLTCESAAANAAFSVSNKDFAAVSLNVVDSRAVSLLNSLVDKTNADDFGSRVIKLADAKGSNTAFPKPVDSSSSSVVAPGPPPPPKM